MALIQLRHLQNSTDDDLLIRAAQKAEVEAALNEDMEFLADIDVDGLLEEHNERIIYENIRIEAQLNRSASFYLNPSNYFSQASQQLNVSISSVITINDSSSSDLNLIEPDIVPDSEDSNEEILVDSILEMFDDEM